MKKHPLVILAAGIGSRYGGLKQIDPVGPNGEILLDYTIYDAAQAGFDPFIFVIRKEIESDFRSVVEPRWKNRVGLEYVHQDLNDLPAGFALTVSRSKPWGTGHAVYACRHVVKMPFGVCNADDYYGPRSLRLLSNTLNGLSSESRDGVLVGFVLRNTLSRFGAVSRSVCVVNAEGHLQRITEYTQVSSDGSVIQARTSGETKILTGNEVVSMNLWGFTPFLFEHLERDFAKFLRKEAADPKAEFMLPTSIGRLIQDGQGTIKVILTPDEWLGVTYPADKQMVSERIAALVAKGMYPSPLT